MKHPWKLRGAASLCGLVNGLFGGGGGLILLPLLSRWGNLSRRELYATCLAVTFSVSLVSAAVYLTQGTIILSDALPCLLGGLTGGILGGKLYGSIPDRWLNWMFIAFLCYAGVHYLL